MANVFVESATLADIASAIRAKSGETRTYKPSEMPDAILALSDGDGRRRYEAAVKRTLTDLYDSNVVTLREYAYVCPAGGVLRTVNLPNCTTVGYGAFDACTVLSDVNLPNCTTVKGGAFRACFGLKRVILPRCESIGESAFYNCSWLTMVSFPACKSLDGAFTYCSRLISVYLMGSTVVSLTYKNPFYGTPIGGDTSATGGLYGSIFVPMSLLSEYRKAAYWSSYASRIVGVSDV